MALEYEAPPLDQWAAGVPIDLYEQTWQPQIRDLLRYEGANTGAVTGGYGDFSLLRPPNQDAIGMYDAFNWKDVQQNALDTGAAAYNAIQTAAPTVQSIGRAAGRFVYNQVKDVPAEAYNSLKQSANSFYDAARPIVKRGYRVGRGILKNALAGEKSNIRKGVTWGDHRGYALATVPEAQSILYRPYGVTGLTITDPPPTGAPFPAELPPTGAPYPQLGPGTDTYFNRGQSAAAAYLGGANPLSSTLPNPPSAWQVGMNLTYGSFFSGLKSANNANLQTSPNVLSSGAAVGQELIYGAQKPFTSTHKSIVSQLYSGLAGVPGSAAASIQSAAGLVTAQATSMSLNFNNVALLAGLGSLYLPFNHVYQRAPQLSDSLRTAVALPELTPLQRLEVLYGPIVKDSNIASLHSLGTKTLLEHTVPNFKWNQDDSLSWALARATGFNAQKATRGVAKALIPGYSILDALVVDPLEQTHSQLTSTLLINVRN
jgi:hypothetical protein